MSAPGQFHLEDWAFEFNEWLDFFNLDTWLARGDATLEAEKKVRKPPVKTIFL